VGSAAAGLCEHALDHLHDDALLRFWQLGKALDLLP